MNDRSVTTGRLFAAAITIAFLPITSADAEERSAVNTGYFGNVAIQGYDPVAFFYESPAGQG